MQVSIKWLKELVDFDATPEELAEKLTMAGIEVENVSYLNKNLDEKIVVGQITEIHKHPQADKLSLCQVKVGIETVAIVCGAPNVVQGVKVPVALPGSTLPGGTIIKNARIKGMESAGMICSVQELGLNTNLFTREELDGILLLAADCRLGGNIAEAIGLDDVVLTLGLTPNRADCLSMLNVAREVAAITGGHLTLPEFLPAENEENINDLVKVEIIDADLCKRYAARLIRNVRIGPSPLWMQKRLRASGIRPINNVVDVTNYVMLEMGQPLHAFDYDLITKGTIVVRRGKPEEKMVTLDEIERQVDEDTILITDPKGPVAIGGIMGGYDTEVTGKTTNILLEAAYFNSAGIRKTSRKLGLRSEASQRFEKGIDLHRCPIALDRAAQLLQQTAGGEIVKGVVDVYPKPALTKKVRLSVIRTNQILGTDLVLTTIEDIFQRLNFPFLVTDNDSLLVEIPSYRNDIELEIDLIEEVARLYGYENIETSLPSGEITQGKRKDYQRLEDLVKDTLISCSMNEVITFSFTTPKVFDWIKLPADHAERRAVAIYNPLSEEQSVMRTSLIPGLLEVTAKNINRRTLDIRIFELGKIYLPSDQLLPQEPAVLAGLLSGKKPKGWGWAEEPVDYYTLKGVLEAVLEKMGIREVVYEPVFDNHVFHSGRTALLYAAGKEIGIAGEINPEAAENFNISQKCYVFQLRFDLITELAAEVKLYVPLPKYPATDRDLAILVSDDVAADKIGQVIREAAGELLVKATLFDQYKGAQVKEGYKSLAYNLVYQAAGRTLTDEEINLLQQKVRQAVVEQLGADLR